MKFRTIKKDQNKAGIFNFGSLTGREKQIFEMRKTKSTEQVAAIIGISEADVRKLFEGARDKIGDIAQ